MMITAVVIDDEEALRSLLANSLEIFCPEVQVLAEAKNVREGIEAIKAHQPQIVFLDIALSDGTGFDILQQLAEEGGGLDAIDFKVIFTTAHEQYAVQAFRFSALDYLLKPIDPDLLEAAVQKFQAEQALKAQSVNLDVLFKNMKQLNSAPKKISLSTSDRVHVCPVDDILYCESEANYTHFYIKGEKPLLISKPLKEYEELLRDHQFERVHQSYLINVNHMKTFVKTDGGYVLMDNGAKIPVSKRKRDRLIELLKSLQ